MSYRATIEACLDAGERVQVHFWFDRREVCWRMKTLEPMPPEHCIYLVEATDHTGSLQSHIDPRRLLLLPLARARELLEQARGFDLRELDRDGLEVRDSLERALRKPERFGVDAYGRLDLHGLRRGRAMTTEEKLASIPRCEGIEAPATPYVPPRAQVTRGPDNDNDPVWRELLAQVGMSIGADGRYSVRPQYHAALQGPVRPYGPAQGTTEYWAHQLEGLDHGPTYLNDVPVRRLPCTPMRFEIASYELSANVGLGSGARERITKVMTLWEAAAFVRAGKCPHYKHSATSHRWSETA
jgi:hypothetical protein